MRFCRGAYVVGAVLLALGCGAEGSSGDAGASVPPAYVRSFAASNVAGGYLSYVQSGMPFEVRFGAVLGANPSDPCEGIREVDEGYRLLMELGRGVPGEYSVRTDARNGKQEAEVTIVELEDGDRRGELVASRGTVVLGDGAASSDDLQVELDLHFSAVQEIECRGFTGSASRPPSYTCICRLPDGSEETCESEDMTSCCSEVTTQEWSLRTTLSLVYCPKLCTYEEPDLAAHCGEF